VVDAQLPGVVIGVRADSLHDQGQAAGLAVMPARLVALQVVLKPDPPSEVAAVVQGADQRGELVRVGRQLVHRVGQGPSVPRCQVNPAGDAPATGC
jgi:hypothetical protein